VSDPKEAPAPKMMEQVLLRGWVNGYSVNQEGTDPNPIVSVFIPDGGNGFHGPEGTTVWLTRRAFDALERPADGEVTR
jgi:hypothetical protein